MIRQLILMEVATKLVTGLILLIMPQLALRIAGLPRSDQPLWARVLGGASIGLAVAAFIDIQLPGTRGIGLAGLVAVNLALAAAIGLQMILSLDGISRRGRILLAIICGALVTASLVEIAFISPSTS